MTGANIATELSADGIMLAGIDTRLTGNAVGPVEALVIGLVAEVVPADQLIPPAKRRVRNISRKQAPSNAPDARFATAPLCFCDGREALHADRFTLLPIAWDASGKPAISGSAQLGQVAT